MPATPATSALTAWRILAWIRSCVDGPVGGAYTWSYGFALSADQNANAGLPPVVTPVPHINLTFGSFLTLYDFTGYVAGSCTAPSGWSCTSQNTGFTPDDVLPNDDPNVANMTWVYTTGPTLSGQPVTFGSDPCGVRR